MSDQQQQNTNDITDYSCNSYTSRSHLDSGIANMGRTFSNGLSTQNNTRSRINSKRISMVDEDSETGIESLILNAQEPFQSIEQEEITVNGQRGIWLNRAEVSRWRGDLPINEYPINEDKNPKFINKVSSDIEYVQELAIRYLRPPTPPSPGDVVITESPATRAKAAPPVIIRQQPPRPITPEPLVLREEPPSPPPVVPIKRISISGKKLPPPPRKVIIERLPEFPPKPQPVIIERWLPYPPVKRKVIYQRLADEREEVQIKPRNVIIQWESPNVTIRQELKNLGVIKANPVDYIKTFGNTLRHASQMPQYVLDIENPNGVLLAAEYDYNPVHQLEGEIEALNFIDLTREGLEMYRPQLDVYNSRNRRDQEAFSVRVSHR